MPTTGTRTPSSNGLNRDASMSANSSPETRLSSATRSYITGVVCLTIGALVYGISRGPVPNAQTLVTWAGAFLIGEVMRFRTPTGKGNVSMAITIHLAAVPLLPMSTLLPAAWMARLTADLIVMRDRWYRALLHCCPGPFAGF